MSHITTHVLDTARGRPAAGVVVVLEQAVGDPPILATATSDEGGRVTELGPERLEPGVYRLRFNTGGYFADHAVPGFYPEVVVSIEVREAEHYHVPLLLSPFGYSTYRGHDLGIVLGPNQYGKAENRVVRIYRETPRHEIHDLNVSTALRGDFDDAHMVGDQAQVLPTDTQKNTVFAFAKSEGVDEIEDFALSLGRHFVDDVEPVTGSRVEVEEYAWDRIEIDGDGHDHSFVRRSLDVRTTVVTVDGMGDDQQAWVVSGLRDLVVLKSTGSEFAGFLEDEFTTLAATHDRVMSTSLAVRWRYSRVDVDWRTSYDVIRATLLEKFATVHSLALQQTLYEMGKTVLERQHDVAEIRLSAPNIHHFVVDLERFGLDNPGEVFHAADRPYGLIQVAVLRDDGPDPGRAWDTVPGFC